MMERFIVVRRLGRLRAASVLVGVGLVLGACTARGGGQLGPPLDSAILATYQGQATFGFTFRCEVKGGKAVIRGELDYQDHAPSTIAGMAYPAITLHGVVDPIFTEAATCAAAAEVFPGSALFQGTYRPQPMDPAVPDAIDQGRFSVQVFDQGKPSRSVGAVTGDGFAIELFGGRYPGYTRAGYIEGGNVQVDP